MMKKMMCFAAGVMFMLAACNENKSEAAVKVDAKPAVQPAAPAKVPTPRIDVPTIDWAKAIEMQAAGAIYVDVRNPNELSEGFAPYAVNIPLPEIKQRYAELPKDKDLLVYCRSGRRSEVASKFLMNNGYTRVYNVAGGFLAFPKK